MTYVNKSQQNPSNNFNLYNSDRKILSYFVSCMKHLEHIFMSHDYIAKKIGFCDRTVRRSIERLKKMGLLYVIVRARKKTSNIYLVSPAAREILFPLRKVLASALSGVKQAQRPILGGGVLLIKEFVYNTVYRVTCRAKRAVLSVPTRLKKYRNWEIRMENDAKQVEGLKISPTLQAITKKFNLTRLGQVKLLVFHDDILTECFNELTKKHGIKDPYNWLVINCTRLHESRKTEPDWQLFHIITKRYRIDKDQPYVAKPRAKIPHFQAVPDLPPPMTQSEEESLIARMIDLARGSNHSLAQIGRAFLLGRQIPW